MMAITSGEVAQNPRAGAAGGGVEAEAGLAGGGDGHGGHAQGPARPHHRCHAPRDTHHQRHLQHQLIQVAGNSLCIRDSGMSVLF